MLDWSSIYKDIEDRLAPQLQLDAWERTTYYHLLRHTRLIGIDSALFSIGPLSTIIPLSDFKVRDVLRSLDRKGCTKNEVTRRGYQIKVYLPDEIGSLRHEISEAKAVDIEAIDFFDGRKFLVNLLAREEYSCFYCLAKVTEENCELDHVIPKAQAQDNSYKNIVVSCHSCNRKKRGQDAPDFLRTLFRQGLLSEEDLQARMQVLENLKSGGLVPRL